MEFFCNEILDHVINYCDMWSSYQLACTCKILMEVFTTKLEYLARRGFTGFAQVIYGTRLPRGFAQILLVHYFKNIKKIESRPDYSSFMSFSTIEHIINNFMLINGFKDVVISRGVDVHVMLNVKLSPEYKEQNVAAVARLMFQLLNAGQVSLVAAIVYLQRFTPEYTKRVIFGIFCDKVMYWLHPDFAGDINIDEKAMQHICRECIYGNFNHYDIELANKLPELRCDVDCLDHHIAYAYKYVNYW